MTLLVNNEIITVVAPEKSDKVRINLPSGNSIVNLRCSLTQQAVFSFDRDEIVDLNGMIKILKLENVVGRIGGDEFVVLGHFDNQKEASILASRMGVRLSNLSIHIEGSENIKVSASVGHVVFDSAPDSIDVMLKSAYKSMYSAKKENKSRTSYTLS